MMQLNALKIFLLFVFLNITTQTLQAQSLTWAHGIGGSSAEGASRMVHDAQGNIYVVGVFQSTVDFDPSASTYFLTSNGGYDIFVAAYTSSGSFLWAFSIGGSNQEAVNDLALDKNNKLLIAGSFSSSNVDFDPHPSNTNIFHTSGGSDAYLAKYDLNGNHIFAYTFAGSGSENLFALCTDNQNNIIISGVFNSATLDLNPGSGTFIVNFFSTNDLFFVKLDSNAAFILGFTISGNVTEVPYCLTTDVNDNIILAGYFMGTNVDFDPDTGTYLLSSTNGLSNPDIFLMKLSPTGRLKWAFAIGHASGSDNMRSVVIHNNFIYTCGDFWGTVDFSHGAGTGILTSNGGKDIFLAKYDSNGTCQWAFNTGGANSSVFEVGAKIHIRNGHIYLVGTVNAMGGSIDFDFGSSTFNVTTSDPDIFLAKYSLNGVFVWAFTLNGTGSDLSFASTIDASGSIYMSGQFYNANFDVDPFGTYNITHSGGSDIFIVKYDATPMPVQWLYVNANRQSSEDVAVEWGCASESDNDFFTVERSVDLKHWKQLANVKGKGTSTVATQYRFIDQHELEGTSYYRVKQTDFNGQFSYSNVAVVHQDINSDFALFPNPARKSFVMSIDIAYHGGILTIRDFTGKPLLTVQQYNGTLVNVEALPAGTYIAEYITTYSKVNRKLVVQ